MQNLNYTWGNCLAVVLALGILYFLLRFLERWQGKLEILGPRQNKVREFIHVVLLVFEPIALLVLGVVFILVNPLPHGVAIGLVLLIGFDHFRSYFGGRLIQFDKNIKTGYRISIGNNEGIIDKIGRLGLRLKTSKGQQFHNYSQIMSEGYLVHAGDEVGGFYLLEIASGEKENKNLLNEIMMDILVATPYVDWGSKPELEYSNSLPGTFTARVSLKEENHLRDLIELLEEKGFNVNVN
ncbi:MAG: mechanosensitive ion channel domain-containing protein [Bacteroidota bacterium]